MNSSLCFEFGYQTYDNRDYPIIRKYQCFAKFNFLLVKQEVVIPERLIINELVCNVNFHYIF